MQPGEEIESLVDELEAIAQRRQDSAYGWWTEKDHRCAGYL